MLNTILTHRKSLTLKKMNSFTMTLLASMMLNIRVQVCFLFLILLFITNFLLFLLVKCVEYGLKWLLYILLVYSPLPNLYKLFLLFLVIHNPFKIENFKHTYYPFKTQFPLKIFLFFYLQTSNSINRTF